MWWKYHFRWTKKFKYFSWNYRKNKKIIRKTIEENPRVGKRYLENITGIPATTLNNYLNNVLRLKKSNLKLVAHFLPEPQKKQRYDFCDNFLKNYGDNKKI